LPAERGDATLLQWLREIGLTGTKLGCGEGGCGACTVMLSHWEGDREHGHVVHRSANACLCPLYAVEGMHVVTVEGIGNMRSGMHPVQSQLANSHGSQCGFCTPGFVMSMYSLLRSSDEPPTEEDIEDALGGNLCRCTGYRPILDAFKTFAKTDPKAYTEEAIAAAKGLSPNTATNGTLPANGAAANGSHANGSHANGTANGASKGCAANGCGANGCSPNGCGANGCATKEASPAPAGKICPSSGLPCDCGSSKAGKSPSTSSEVFVMGGGVKQDGKRLGPPPGTAEPIFPPELKGRAVTELCMPGPRLTWYRPTSLARLLQLKAEHPNAKLVVGNTEVGIEMKFKAMQYPVVVSPVAVPELNQLETTEKGVEIGAAVTLTNLMKYFKHLIATRPAHETSSCCAVVNQLRWFAGNQIRNVSALGGNIVTGSPISDLNPVWMASGATFTVASAERGCRDVPAANFFLGYRTVDMKPDEILLKVTLPFTRKYEYVKEFKQAPRREDDIAIVNAGMRIRMEQDNQTGGWVVAEAAMAYGGVAAKAVRADQTCAMLVGKPLDQGTLGECLRVVQKDVAISDNAPGGRVEYRRALVASFLFKFFVHVANMLEADSQNTFRGDFPPEFQSAAQPYHRPPSHGVQYHALETSGAQEVVGVPHPHMAADLQVSGEAGYTDDIKLSSDALVAVLVTSSKPHARLTRVDASKALEVPGVVAYFGAKDVPGSNFIGPVVQDEEVFATEYVTAVGQPIGVIVAEDEGAARRAVRLVDVGYEDLPAIMSCEEAYEAGSYYNYTPKILSGDPEGALAKADHVIEGTFKLGGQEHFYLEPQNCCVIPHENDELTLYASTQAPSKHQKAVALTLGVPLHKIVSKTKRVGGGFGGKETRSIYMHCCAAVPAHHLRRPVRLCLDRDEDMQSTGHRHAFMCHYKVGFSKDGRVSALDATLYSNVGNSMDLSASVMDRALMHSDCCYNIPNVRVVGKLCKTNQASNTAFRGFGGPQGAMFAEMWVEQIAKVVGKPDHEVRQLNMYKEGDITHFGQAMEHCRVGPCWEQAMRNSQYETRRAQVDAYNSSNRWRKRGIAITPTKFGISFTTKFLNQAGALVHVYLDGTVLVTHGGVEMGQGLHTKMAQVAAQALGTPLSKVFISETSTDKVPNSSPTAASASSDMYGGAILDACKQINARLQPVKERMPGAGWKDIVNAAYLDRIDLSAHGFYATPDITGFGGNRPFNYFCFGTAASEVELDVLTGDMQVLRTDIVMDVGNPINPAIDIGQVEGGFVQGMGWLCLEELQWGDKQHPWVRPGHLQTKGPGTYKIPSANDIPVDFRVSLLQDAPNVRAVHSSKAVGEPPFHLGASVFFALKDAVYAARRDAGLSGYVQLDAPATPERLRMLCGDPIAQETAGGAHFRAKISC